MSDVPDQLTQARLYLFMTRGMSLEKWARIGTLERELAAYQRLRAHLGGVTIVSYGGARERALVAGFPGLDLICNRWGLPLRVYVRALEWRLPREHHRMALYKSNQVTGAEVPALLAARHRVPFIARCGYLPSEGHLHTSGADSLAFREAAARERAVFRAATCSVVTTQRLQQRVLDYGVPRDRVALVPNAVDVSLFCPAAAPARATNRLLYVGRLDEEKAPQLLIRAAVGLDVTLDLVGGGSLRTELERLARELGVDVRFHGNLPNPSLPELMRSTTIYVLPSRYEGHPKALLEAMACGAAVIGTRVPGVQEVIRHNQTGLLCDPSVDGLGQAIRTLLADEALRRSLGEAARAFVAAEHDLDSAVERELAVYRQALAAYGQAGEGAACPG